MVRAIALEIRWHDTNPVYSADIHKVAPVQHLRHPAQQQGHPYASASGTGDDQLQQHEVGWRLATAGGDKLIRLWFIVPRPLITNSAGDKVVGRPRVEYLSTLNKHAAVVNVVRFCPKGDMLASAGDDGAILFWVPGDPGTSFGESAEDKAYEREPWRVKSMVRGKSGQEIYDISWSPDGTYLLAGSVDATANIYDVATGSLIHTIAEHTNYVQGVCWDPRNSFIATQSSDRSMRVYSVTKLHAGGLEVHGVSGKVNKLELEKPANGGTWPSDDEYAAAARGRGSEQHQGGGRRRRSISHAASDRSDRSESRQAPRPSSLAANEDTKSMEKETPMDPPPPSLHRRPSSSSTTSITAALPVRSPSPAPPVPTVAARSPATHEVISTLPPPPVASTSGASGTEQDLALPPPQRERINLYASAEATPFFRRLAWSTDGSLLVTPAGTFEDPFLSASAAGSSSSSSKDKDKEGSPKAEGKKKKKDKAAAATPAATEAEKATSTVYLYARSNLGNGPVARLPGHKTTSIAIRFCPVLYELRKEVVREPVSITLAKGKEQVASLSAGGGGGGGVGGEEKQEEDESRPASVFDLPYRMVYAVATLDCVFLYDTQQAGPIALFGNLHYAPFTDVAWSPDGLTLVLSSQDGYCSVVSFEPEELGKEWIRPPSSAVAPPTSTSAPAATAGPSKPVVPVAAATPAAPAVAVAPVPAPAPEAAAAAPAGPSTIPAKRKEEELTAVDPPVATNGAAAAAATAAAAAEAEGGQQKKKKRVQLNFVSELGS